MKDVGVLNQYREYLTKIKENYLRIGLLKGIMEEISLLWVTSKQNN